MPTWTSSWRPSSAWSARSHEAAPECFRLSRHSGHNGRTGGPTMMMMSQRFVAGFTAVAFAVALSGCASSGNPQPSVFAYPAKGQTPEQQARDSSECQTWAKGQSGWDPTTDTAKGVGIGAAVGALGGAAGGIGGATYGGTSQYGKGKAGYDSAYAACMNGRGYTTK